MGCDIHPHVEVRSGDRWEAVERRREPTSPTSWRHTLPNTFDLGRNYYLFSHLAGVRSGYGGQEIAPIAEPRGLPEDLSPEVRFEANSWEGDLHSSSWFTLAELDEVPWDEFPWAETLIEGMAVMAGIAEERDLEHDRIRLVFWFDS